MMQKQLSLYTFSKDKKLLIQAHFHNQTLKLKVRQLKKKIKQFK